MSTKVPLDLTVEEKFQIIARELAKKRQLSVSQLFEQLVEEEKRRTATQKKSTRLSRLLEAARTLASGTTLAIAAAVSLLDWRMWLGIAIVGAFIVDATDGKLDLLGGLRLW